MPKAVSRGGGSGNGGGKRPAESNKSGGPLDKSKKKKKKGNGGLQQTLFGVGVEKIDKAPLFIGQCMLFSDAIYEEEKHIPKECKDKLFLYFVKSYDAETKEFTVKYRNNMIAEDGVKWISQDGNREDMDGVTLKQVEEGIELYRKALGRVSAHEHEEKAVAEGNLKKRATVLTPEEVDTTDLDEASIVNPDKGWRSQAVLDVSVLLYFCLMTCVYHRT